MNETDKHLPGFDYFLTDWIFYESLPKRKTKKLPFNKIKKLI